MKKTFLGLAVMAGVVCAGGLNTGCSPDQKSFIEALLVPLAHAAVDGSIDYTVGVAEHEFGQSIGQGTLNDAATAGFGAALDNLLNGIADQTVREWLPPAK